MSSTTLEPINYANFASKQTEIDADPQHITVTSCLEEYSSPGDGRRSSPEQLVVLSLSRKMAAKVAINTPQGEVGEIATEV